MARLISVFVIVTLGFFSLGHTQDPQNLLSPTQQWETNADTPESPQLHLDDLMSPDEIYQELQNSEEFQIEEREHLSPERGFELQSPLDLLNLLSRQQNRAPELSPLLPEESAQRYGLDWFREFDFVIVINKATQGPTAQRALVYVRGQHYATFAVSTGREKNEVAKSGKRYFSTTPTGWYSPTFLSRNHVSSLWRVRMPFAVFFTGGIATHAALPGSYKDLGKRASGGCVRLRTDDARWIFETVQSAGKGMVPRFHRNGEPVRDRNGHIQYAQNWRSLIIVVNREGQ